MPSLEAEGVLRPAHECRSLGAGSPVTARRRPRTVDGLRREVADENLGPTAAARIGNSATPQGGVAPKTRILHGEVVETASSDKHPRT